MKNDLNQNQRAAARQLSLAAYLIGGEGQAKDERQIQDRIPFYDELLEWLLSKSDPNTAHASFGTQLKRDVEDLASAGIRVEVSQDSEDGHRTYRLPQEGYSPGELALTEEERAVLLKALATFGREFPYSAPLHLALYNLMDALGAGQGGIPFDLPYDEALARAIAKLDVALSRRRAVAFDYYAISADETSSREVEPYALSLIRGSWYVTGRDRGQDDVRQFRLSRIQGNIRSVKAGASSEYEIPDLDPALYGPRAPWQLGEARAEASILLPREQGELLERMHPGAGRLEPRDEESLYLTSYDGERQLIGTVLSLGNDARVLAPEELVERTALCLRRLIELHAPGGVGLAPGELEEVEEEWPQRSRASRSSGVKPARPELELALARYLAELQVEGPKTEISIPIDELAEELGCSKEQVKKSLQSVMEISDYHVVVISYELRDGEIVKIMKSPFDRDFGRRFRLSLLQSRAALLALDLISETVDPDLMDRLREKVRRAGGGEMQEISTDKREADDPLVAHIQESIRNRRILRIRYPSGGRVKQRDVEPARMVNAHGSWYLSAYCRDADDTRLFRLDRILQTHVLDQAFAGRLDAEAPDSPDDADPRLFAQGRATIRFSPEVARWMEGKPTLELERRYEDGTEDHTLYYADLFWAAGRVMLYRGEAVVVEPEELREEVRRRSQARLDFQMENR